MKIDRLVSIIMMLLDKKHIGYRDIDTINMAVIPVCSIPGMGVGFEIMSNYKIDKNIFSTTDRLKK